MEILLDFIFIVCVFFSRALGVYRTAYADATEITPSASKSASPLLYFGWRTPKTHAHLFWVQTKITAFSLVKTGETAVVCLIYCYLGKRLHTHEQQGLICLGKIGRKVCLGVARVYGDDFVVLREERNDGVGKAILYQKERFAGILSTPTDFDNAVIAAKKHPIAVTGF